MTCPVINSTSSAPQNRQTTLPHLLPNLEASQCGPDMPLIQELKMMLITSLRKYYSILEYREITWASLREINKINSPSVLIYNLFSFFYTEFDHSKNYNYYLFVLWYDLTYIYFKYYFDFFSKFFKYGKPVINWNGIWSVHNFGFSVCSRCAAAVPIRWPRWFVIDDFNSYRFLLFV